MDAQQATVVGLGMMADEDRELKAARMAVRAPAKKRIGLSRNTSSAAPRTTKWMSMPAYAATTKPRKGPMTAGPLTPMTAAIRANTPNGMSCRIARVTMNNEGKLMKMAFSR